MRSIHAFHFVNTSAQFATKLLIDLVDSADILEKMPRIAPVEPDFADLGEVRGLLVKQKGRKPQYKLMYLLEGETCYILAVWNTHRNPSDKVITVRMGLEE